MSIVGACSTVFEKGNSMADIILPFRTYPQLPMVVLMVKPTVSIGVTEVICNSLYHKY